MLDFLRSTFRLLQNNADVLWDGFIVTLQLCLVGQILALALGLVVALMRLSKSMILRAIAASYVEFFRDTPFLIQLFWIYYVLPSLGVSLDSFTAAVIAITLYIGSYNAEILRAGIQAVPRGQLLAARGLGMSYPRAMWRILLPQAVAMMIPPLVSSFVNLVKSTAITATISVNELTHAGIYIGFTTLRSLEILTAISIVYFIIILPFDMIATRIEKQLIERVKK